MANKIKRVTSINSQGTKVLAVGKGGITRIKDNSLEYETSIHIQFDAYNQYGDIVGTFINGALSIDYFKNEI